MPLQPHSRRTSGEATAAAAIVPSWRPGRRRGAAGAAGSCSLPGGQEVRGTASFRSSRGTASRVPPGADVSVCLQEARTRPDAGTANRPARAVPRRHGPSVGAAAHAARASQERPTGEDTEPGVRGGTGDHGGPRGRGHTTRPPPGPGSPAGREVGLGPLPTPCPAPLSPCRLGGGSDTRAERWAPVKRRAGWAPSGLSLEGLPAVGETALRQGCRAAG